MKTTALPFTIFLSSLLYLGSIISGCQGQVPTPPAKNVDQTNKPGKESAEMPVTKQTGQPSIPDAPTILARKQVPILCYHHIREFRPSDSKTSRDYIVPPSIFKDQMKLLADSGYHTILPDELYTYLVSGTPLPRKPIMLSFDDTDQEQFDVAAPELKKYGFKGVFFIMTVSLGRPHYMTQEQVRILSQEGHVIGAHTWDHHNVKKYTGPDWNIQVEKPMKLLAEMTGKPVKYFAYPFGLWNKEAIPELKKRGIKAAFQLISKRDEGEPLYTIRRTIVPGEWDAKEMLTRMKKSF